MARRRKPPAAQPDKAELVYRDVRQLKAYPRNARTHPRDQLDALKAGLRRFGWTRPILIDERDEIVAGHGIKFAAVELWEDGETIARTPAPWMAPTICCAGWTDDEKRAYILFDNRSAELSGWDDGLRVAELIDLRDAGFDITLTGHDATELAALIQRIDDMNKPPPEEEAGDDSNRIGTKFEIIVECPSEEKQASLLERLAGEGWTCRALIG